MSRLVALLLVTLALAVATTANALIAQFHITGFNTMHPGKHSMPQDDGGPLTIHVTMHRNGTCDVGLSTEDELGLMPFTVVIRNAVSGAKLPMKHVHCSRFTPRLAEGTVRDVLPHSTDHPESVFIDVHNDREFAQSTYSVVFGQLLEMKPDKYDMAPPNASFGTMFQLNITEQMFSWIVKRRPPIPPFIASIRGAETGKLLKFAFIEKPTADGVMFTNIFDLQQLRKNMTADYHALRLSVTFFEGTRHHTARAKIEKFSEFVNNGLKNDGDAVEVPTEDANGLKFRLQFDEATESAALVFLQPFPIDNFFITVKDGNGTTIFAEAERSVPFISATSTEQQYGWWRIFPLDSMTKIALDTVEITARYDKSPATAEHRETATFKTEEAMRWVTDFGGECSNISPFVPKEKSSGSGGGAKLVALHTNAAIPANQILARVPFRLLLTDVIAMRLDILQTFFASEPWTSFERSHFQGPNFKKILALTVAMVLNAVSPIDGTTWRIMFDTALPKNPPVPLFIPIEEAAALFPPETSLWFELKAQRKQVSDEYDLLADALGQKFKRRVSLEAYTAARSHIVMWTVNATNEFFLSPLFNLLKLEEDPTVRIELDYNTRQLLFVSTRALARHTVLSVGRSAEKTTKTEYYAQYGQVPIAGLDTALAFNNNFITRAKWSRRGALNAIQSARGESKDDDGEDDDGAAPTNGGGDSDDEQAALRKLLEDLRGRLQRLPNEISSTASADARLVRGANRLLKGERDVLQAHIAYLEEDLGEL